MNGDECANSAAAGAASRARPCQSVIMDDHPGRGITSRTPSIGRLVGSSGGPSGGGSAGRPVGGSIGGLPGSFRGRSASLVLIGLALAACAPPAPLATGSAPTPALPPIPLVTGPLVPKVVYPADGHLITSPDSNFVFGSVGNGRATVTVNGAPARVYPNGAFMAWVVNPPASAPRYDVVAVAGADTASVVRQVQLAAPRPRPAAGGPLVDSASVTPRGDGLALRDSEPVRVAVRAAPDAGVSLVAGNVARPLAQSPVVGAGDSTLFAADVPAARLRAGATLIVARGADTARFGVAPVASPDSALPRYVMVGTEPAAPDTDRTVIGRPTPGGTYKWFFLPGTVLEATGHAEGFTRVRLDDALEVWVADGDVHALPATTVAPRRVTANARVRSAPGWEDLVIPIGARPAYEVLEAGRELTLLLYGTRANTDIVNYAGGDTLVRNVEWSQERDGRARYVVHLSQPLYGYLVMWDGGSLVLRIRRPPDVNGRRPLEGRTIVVDPGHPPIGATGPTGLWEPEATLAIGERLRALLEQRGARVVMTRTTMDPVALGDRPIIARRANGDAFVSIHLNAYPDGVDVFDARNGSGTYFFHALSEPLARPVQRGLVARMGLPDLGVNYDNLAVVRPTWMPSILCEGAFVIVPEQEAALRTPEFQERYARGIADGLEAYFRALREAR